jgi:transposase
MPGKAAKVLITERQQEILTTMTRSRGCAQGLAQRAHMILLAFEGWKNEAIAEFLDCERHGVGIWRSRWKDAFGDLVRSECLEEPAALRHAIEKVLSDLPRLGSPGKFTAEQITQIFAVACEAPELSGRPVTHWTSAELAEEVAKRGIVPSISARQVRRFLSSAALKPHQSRYWLNADPKDRELFDAQIREVCECYEQAPQRLEQGIHTSSVDEKPGMQALERRAPTKPMRPGEVEKREFEYIRHGTQVLTANFEIATGEVIAPTVQDTRNEQQFADHIQRTIATDAEAGWIFIADNLNTHCSVTLVLLIAGLCGIPADTLGKKEKSGVLKSMKTRKAFLVDPSHRIRFVYVPKHTSWLNQVEIWFSILVRRVIRRGNFTSKANLREKVLHFIEYYNQTLAKPFKWTYRGRPLNV